MLKTIEKNIWLKIALIVVTLLIIYYLRNVLLPFAIAFMIAYILNPVVNFFNKYLKKRILSVIVTLLLLSAVIFGASVLIFPSMISEISSLYDLLKEKASSTQWSENLPEFLRDYIKNFTFDENIEKYFADGNLSKIFDMFSKIILPRIAGFFSGTVNVISAAFGLTIIILYIIFIMKDYDEISLGAKNLIPQKYKERFDTFIKRFQKEMSNYFRGQLLVVLCVTILYASGFKIIGLPVGITLGILVGILNLVPYLQIAGFLPALLLTVIKSVETDTPLWAAIFMTAAVFVFVQIIQDLILTPYFMGKHTGLNPAMILLSLSIWGKLLGFLGLIVAIPFTCLVRTYYGEYLDEKKHVV